MTTRHLFLAIIAALWLLAACTLPAPTATPTPPPTATLTASPTVGSTPVHLSIAGLVGTSTPITAPTVQRVYHALTAVGIETHRDARIAIDGTLVPFAAAETPAPTPTMTPVPLPAGRWSLCVVSPAGVVVACTPMDAP